MTVGEKIKKAREVKNIAQVELASLVGISKQTLYKYENGIITNIPSNKIEAIAKVLDTTPASLMGWTETPITENNPTENDEVEEEYLLASRSKDGKRGIEILTKAEYETAKAFIQTLRKNTNEEL